MAVEAYFPRPQWTWCLTIHHPEAQPGGPAPQRPGARAGGRSGGSSTQTRRQPDISSGIVPNAKPPTPVLKITSGRFLNWS